MFHSRSHSEGRILTGIPYPATYSETAYFWNTGSSLVRGLSPFISGKAKGRFTQALHKSWEEERGKAMEATTALCIQRQKQVDLEYRTLLFGDKLGTFIQDLQYRMDKSAIASAANELGYALSESQPSATLDAWQKVNELAMIGDGDEVSKVMAHDGGQVLFERLLAMCSRLGMDTTQCSNPYRLITGDARSDEICWACDKPDSSLTHFQVGAASSLGALKLLHDAKPPNTQDHLDASLKKETRLNNKIGMIWMINQATGAQRPSESASSGLNARMKSFGTKIALSPILFRPHFMPQSSQSVLGVSANSEQAFSATVQGDQLGFHEVDPNKVDPDEVTVTGNDGDDGDGTASIFSRLTGETLT